MITYEEPLLYIVLGLSAIVLLLFCSVTSCVHSEVKSVGKYVFFFHFYSQHCVTDSTDMVDGKIAGTSSIVKAALSKLSSWVIHVTAVFVLQGWSTWISPAPY